MDRFEAFARLLAIVNASNDEKKDELIIFLSSEIEYELNKMIEKNSQ